MRISDWSSDVCSSDLACGPFIPPSRWRFRKERSMAHQHRHDARLALGIGAFAIGAIAAAALQNRRNSRGADASALGRTARHGRGRKLGDSTVIGQTATVHRRSDEHTSELQSLIRISYAVFSLKQNTHKTA